MPKVSVIIPTCNYASYISKALDSIMCQSFQDFEIIVVDDGSTDTTKALVDSYLVRYSPKIKYFYQHNQGPAAARNFGIKEAQGIYVAFCDSDDTWKKEKLDEQIGFLENNPGVMLVFSDMEQQVESGIFEGSYLRRRNIFPNKFSDMYSALIERGTFIFTPTVVLRRAVLEKVGVFNEQYRVGEDYDLWLRITKEYKASFIDKPLVTRFFHSKSISRNKEIYFQDNIALLLALIDRVGADRKHKIVLRKKLMRCRDELGYYYFERGERDKAGPLFLQSFVMCPTSQLGFKAFFYLVTTLLPVNVIAFLRRFKQGVNLNAKS